MYECVMTFTSKEGEDFYYGQKIPLSRYLNLEPIDRLKFTPVYVQEEEEDEEDSITDGIIELGATLLGAMLSNMDEKASDNSSSFDGFDGGDFGGAGAGSDW